MPATASARQAFAVARRIGDRPSREGQRTAVGGTAHTWKFRTLVGAIRLLTPALILGVFAALVRGAIPGSSWAWALTAACFVLFFAVVPKDGPPGPATEITGKLLLGAVALFTTFALFYYLLCRLLATRWTLGLIAVVVPLAALVAAAAVVLGLPKLRRQFFGEGGEESYQVAGVLGPFSLLAVLLVIMSSVFALVTVAAAEQGWTSLSANSDLPSFEQVVELYVWQFCKSVPLLDINETLRWQPPFIYTGSLTAVLVLAYKLAVIIPLIGAFAFYWHHQIDPAERPRPSGG